MRAALTFDDGPSGWTTEILDLFRKHGGHASFFALGSHVHTREETLRRIVAEGHDLGCHGWTHRRMTTLEDGDVRLELDATCAILRAATGVRPTLWRAPHHDIDSRIQRVAAGCGLTHVGRTVDPGDWSATDADRIVHLVLTNLSEDAIVNLHDGVSPRCLGSRSRRFTVRAVEELLRCDVEWVPVSELL